MLRGPSDPDLSDSVSGVFSTSVAGVSGVKAS